MSYRHWTEAQRKAVAYAFSAWAENQYDDMRAGGGQDPDQVNHWLTLAGLLEANSVPLSLEEDRLAVEDAAWNALDTPDAFEDLDMHDLREALRVAGWRGD
jgi:hypothetical protein